MNDKQLLQEEQSLREWENMDCDDVAFDLDALESQLQGELDEQLADLSVLEEDREKIGNPDSLGNIIKDVVWEQFLNQIGVSAGEDFIRENRGLNFDPRNKAHIQTAKNFAKGKLANHNYRSIESLESNYDRYKNRYENYHQFRKDYVDPGMDETLSRAGQLNSQGQKTVRDIYTGKQIPTKTKLENGKNNPMSAQREHVKSVSELYRRDEKDIKLQRKKDQDRNNHCLNKNDPKYKYDGPAPSLHMSYSDEELAAIFNDPQNLQGYTTAERNRRKSDGYAEELEPKDKTSHWKEANSKAEKFIEKKKQEGEERLKKEGRETQKEEIFRMGGKTLRSVVMGLLADLVKDIIGKLVVWLRSANKKFSTFIDSVKEGIKKFFSNLKQHLKTAGNTLFTTITTAVVGPIVGMIKKALIFLKQGYNSVRDAIKYLRNPENKKLPFSIKMLNVGKILIAGLTAGGAIVLGEVIEKGLLAIPAFAIQIPLLGSLASIIGIFLGAIVCGIIGALALRIIDKLIAKRLERLNTSQQIDKRNEILLTQEKLVVVNEAKMYKAIDDTMSNVSDRHKQAEDIMRSAYGNIMANSEVIKNSDSPTTDEQSENKNDLDDLFDKLAEI